MDLVIRERAQHQFVGPVLLAAIGHAPDALAHGAPNVDDGRQSNNRARLRRSALRAIWLRRIRVMFRGYWHSRLMRNFDAEAEVTREADDSKRTTTDVMCGGDFRLLPKWHWWTVTCASARKPSELHFTRNRDDRRAPGYGADACGAVRTLDGVRHPPRCRGRWSK